MVAALVAATAILRDRLAQAGIQAVAAATGFPLTLGRLALQRGGLDARDVNVRNDRGETIAAVDHVALKYSLGDLISGARAFGLRALDIEGARLSIVRRPDGSFNVPLPHLGGNGKRSAPYRFRATVRDVAIAIDDRYHRKPQRLTINNVRGDFDIDTLARSRYTAQATYVEDGRRYPINGRGDVDVHAGVGVQRWTAASVPLARIAAVALNSATFTLAAGTARDVELRMNSLAVPGGPLHDYVTGGARLQDARFQIGGLARPVRDVNGYVALYDDGLVLQNVRAAIAGVPMHLDGSIYNLSAPRLRIAVTGRGDLRDLRSVVAQGASLPVSGGARLDVSVEGPTAKPIALIDLRSPRIVYGPIALGRAGLLMAFDGDAVNVVDAGARYRGVAVSARGLVAVRRPVPKKGNALTVLARADAPAGMLPYIGSVATNVPVRGYALIDGPNPQRARARGIVYGHHDATSLAGTFDVRLPGTGTFGPLRLTSPQESLYAVASIDTARRGMRAFLNARNVRLDSGLAHALTGGKLPSLAGTVDADIAATQRNGILGGTGVVRVHDARVGAVRVARAQLRFGSTSQSNVVAALSAGGIEPLGALASATLAYDRGTIDVRDAAAATGTTFATVRGTVDGASRGALRYDLATQLHSADAGALADAIGARAPVPVEGTLEAQLRVSGNGRTPQVRGTVALPEGAVNGLAFHGLNANVSGSPGALSLSGGRVGVGSSAVAFWAQTEGGMQRVAVSAPHVDLSDFNDAFDAGDMFAGRGQLDAHLAFDRGRLSATAGTTALHGAALRNFQFGAAQARWSGAADRIATAMSFAGPSGRVTANGTLGLDGTVDMAAHARDVDLAYWLPLAGVPAPITGIADADTTVSGRYPDLDARATANVAHASVGRVALQRLSLSARLQRGAGRLNSMIAELPHGRIDGSGTFGLHSGDPLGLRFHIVSDDAAALASTALGKTFDASGKLDSTLSIGGTRSSPSLDDDFAMTDVRYGAFHSARAIGRLHVDRRTASLRDGEIDLDKGRILAQATVPIRLTPLGLDRRGRISGSLTADDVEASNLAGVLPKGTTVNGRVDGRLDVGGTIRAPRWNGALDLANGYYSGPQETIPITNAAASLAFRGNRIFLQNARADAGGGTLAATGSATVPNLRDPRAAALSLAMRADALTLDLPQYVKGRFDGNVSLSRTPGQKPLLAGSVTMRDARIALDGLVKAKPAGQTTQTLPDVGFDVAFNAGPDVRVVSSNVDVGTSGAVHIGGSLRAPALNGSFESTGGTVSFLRDFRIQHATVAFDPSDGIVPTVNATATTYIRDPSTNVRIHVTGPATQMNVAFTSDPYYDREQILGLLANAQSLGAVRGVATTGGGFSGSSLVGQLAGSRLNSVFTRNLLEPLSVALGGGLGLQNFQISNDINGGLGINAVKAFGNYLSFIFSETFNEGRRTTWTLQANPSSGTRLDLTAYSQDHDNPFTLSLPPARYTVDGTAVTTPLSGGTNGVAFRYRRLF